MTLNILSLFATSSIDLVASILHKTYSMKRMLMYLKGKSDGFDSWIQIVDISVRMTLKFNEWPCKTIGHLFYAMSSFVHYFKAISEFKLESQSANAQLGSKSAIFLSRCDLEIWHMTLKIYRAPHLYFFKLCVSFHSHWWIQTGGIVQKRPIWVKICNFCPVWPSNLTDDLQTQ